MVDSPLKDLFHSAKVRELRLLLSQELSHYKALQKSKFTTPVITNVTFAF